MLESLPVLDQSVRVPVTEVLFVEWHIIHQVMVFLGLEFEEALLTYPVRSDQIGIHKRSSFVGSPATEDSL